MDPDQIIIEPVVTEKTNTMRESHKYAFKVNPKANKHQIKEALKKMFEVNPVKCQVINVKRKPKRMRYQLGYTATWKKVIVTLPSSEKIDIFEGA